MSPEAYTAEAIQQAIAQGAITEAYQADPQQVIQELNRLRATEVLGRGLPVAIPTETVYGLAADATNPEAIARIYETKGRPRFNPLICHVADLEMAERHAVFDPISRKLAEAFWPGPLTLILPVRPDTPIHPLARAGLDTVGIRVPAGFAERRTQPVVRGERQRLGLVVLDGIVVGDRALEGRDGAGEIAVGSQDLALEDAADHAEQTFGRVATE